MGLHQIFHTFIALYVFFGWALFPEIHAPSCAAILVHWLVNKNRCVFSDTYDDPNGFTTELLQKVGIDISKSDTLKSLIPYILVIIPFSVSLYLGFTGYSFGATAIRTALTYFLSAVPFIAIFRRFWASEVAGEVAGEAADTNASADKVENEMKPMETPLTPSDIVSAAADVPAAEAAE